MLKKLWLVVFIVFIGCKQKNSTDKNIKLETQPFKYTLNIEVKSNDSVMEYRFLFQEDDFKKIRLPVKKIIVNGTSSLGFLESLNARKEITAVTNPHYIYDSVIQEKIKTGIIENIGIQGSVDVEKIVKLNPDIFLSYSDPNMTKIHQKLENLGIPVILIDDFKEKTPLGKVEWIKFFGVLLDKKEEARLFFDQVETQYNQLKKEYSLQTKKPRILVDIMYGDVWYLPDNHSFLAQFIQDAGGEYVFEKEEDEVLNFSFERVFKKAENADIWINASNVQQLKELEAKNHNYALFEAFKKGEVYSLTGNVKNEANNYFEEGIVRPDLILKDLTQIFHPSEKQELKFYKKLD
ncbi:MAG: ABC transporter substrate-binding protein [Flavobacteriales bacterium]